MESLHERTFNPLLQFATLLQFESQEYGPSLLITNQGFVNVISKVPGLASDNNLPVLWTCLFWIHEHPYSHEWGIVPI